MKYRDKLNLRVFEVLSEMPNAVFLYNREDRIPLFVTHLTLKDHYEPVEDMEIKTLVLSDNLTTCKRRFKKCLTV
jgi:hypothetical protein